MPRKPPCQNIDFLLKQKGMFSFTGCASMQVRLLREEFAVYLIGSGHVCMAALTDKTLAPVADATGANNGLRKEYGQTRA